jgi:hypothetical protein
MIDIVTVIPVHNYIDGLYKITNWINAQYSKLFNTYKVIIVNDNSDAKYNNDFEKIKKSNSNFEVINLKKEEAKNLKVSLNKANKYNSKLINVIETDAIPNTKVFKSMIQLYNQNINEKIASVSPMYTWQNKYCYPTHQHWHTDGLNVPNGRFEIKGIGKVAKVGGAGVPFLFSLWNPIIFKEINKKEFRSFLNLDSDFGNYCYKLGYEHYRLLDCNIEHYNKGKASRNG